VGSASGKEIEKEAGFIRKNKILTSKKGKEKRRSIGGENSKVHREKTPLQKRIDFGEKEKAGQGYKRTDQRVRKAYDDALKISLSHDSPLCSVSHFLGKS